MQKKNVTQKMNERRTIIEFILKLYIPRIFRRFRKIAKSDY